MREIDSLAIELTIESEGLGEPRLTVTLKRTGYLNEAVIDYAFINISDLYEALKVPANREKLRYWEAQDAAGPR